MSRDILVTGGSGQLGGQLIRLLTAAGKSVIAPSRSELDLANPEKIHAWFEKNQVEMVLNGGAYTAVDLAEDEPDLAFRINAESPKVLAQLTREKNIPFLHLGTDYVFADWKGERRPLNEADPPCPIGVYATSKHQGEQAVLKENPEALVVRTSGVYQNGGKNFISAILRRLAQTGSAQVVNDQFTLPTPADFLAEKCLAAMTKGLTGLLHIVPDGSPSWFETAQEIGTAFTQTTGKAVQITPISTSQLKQKAPRPPWSVLDNQKTQTLLGQDFPNWDDLLKKALESWPVEDTNG